MNYMNLGKRLIQLQLAKVAHSTLQVSSKRPCSPTIPGRKECPALFLQVSMIEMFNKKVFDFNNMLCKSSWLRWKQVVFYTKFKPVRDVVDPLDLS